MNNTFNRSGLFAFILFIVWPFYSVINAIRNFRSSWSKNIVWVFIIFYGYTFVVSSSELDANRYRDKFIQVAKTQITAQNFTAVFFDKNSQNLDIIEPLIIFSLSRLTNNWHLLFVSFGLIFGYFYSRNIWYLVERMGDRVSATNMLLIFVFSLIVGFWLINGFRFWTATHMFFFGAIPFLVEKKTKNLWVAVLAIFMHFSFLIPVAIFIFYVLLGNRVSIYFYFFVATFFISSLNLSAINEIVIAYIPDVFHSRVNSYVNQDYYDGIKELDSKLNWYVILYGNLFKWVFNILLIIIYVSKKEYFKSNRSLFSLFNFCLLLFGCSNLFGLVPSGGRFENLAELFTISFFLFYLRFFFDDHLIKKAFQFAMPIFIFFCVINIRIAFDTIGLATLISNPISSLFFENDSALIQFIK